MSQLLVHILTSQEEVSIFYEGWALRRHGILSVRQSWWLGGGPAARIGGSAASTWALYTVCEPVNLMDDGHPRPYRTAALLLIGVALLIALYSRLTPPFEGPDEPEHFAYVVWLAEGRGFPPQGAAAWDTAVRQEAGQPPLYYVIASLPARIAGTAAPTADFRPNPHFPSSAPGSVPDNKNIAVHYSADGDQLSGGWLALSLARWVSLLAGMLLVAGVYGLAGELFPQQRGLALLTALFAALTPQVLFISGVVSNDMLVAALSTLALWALVRLVQRGPTAGRSAWLGIWLGLAALTKTSALALAVPVTVVLLGMIATRRWSLRQVLLTGGITLGVFLLVAGWWYGRSWLLYGSPLGLDTHDYAPWADRGVRGTADFLLQWEEVFNSYWAAFGWGNIKFNPWIYWLLIGLALVAVAGLARLAWRAWRQGRLSGPRVILFLALALYATAVALALASWMQRVRAPHGRLLFPALAAITILLAIGWRAWHPRLAHVMLLMLAGMTLLAPWRLVAPAYAWPELRDPATVTDRPVGWRFGDGEPVAELLQVDVRESTAVAGGVLPVEVCWNPLSAPSRNLSQLVHLVGAAHQVVAIRHTFPGLGSYPTSAWLVGQAFCDTIRIDIPPDLARTQLYQVEVGWFDAETGERLAAVDAAGANVPSTYAGNVRLEAAGTQYTSAAPTAGGPLQLAEAQFEPRWRVGETAVVTLTWWLTAKLDQEYNTFVHLRDGDTVVAQADGAPLAGWYPVNFWLPQELVVDTRPFEVPAGVAPGTYELVVGWYDFITGERLGAEHRLGTVEVVP